MEKMGIAAILANSGGIAYAAFNESGGRGATTTGLTSISAEDHHQGDAGLSSKAPAQVA